MMNALRMIAFVLVIVGALNWGLVGLFRFDLVNAIFGGQSIYDPGAFSRLIYVLVGLSGLYAITLYQTVKAKQD